MNNALNPFDPMARFGPDGLPTQFVADRFGPKAKPQTSHSPFGAPSGPFGMSGPNGVPTSFQVDPTGRGKPMWDRPDFEANGPVNIPPPDLPQPSPMFTGQMFGPEQPFGPPMPQKRPVMTGPGGGVIPDASVTPQVGGDTPTSASPNVQQFMGNINQDNPWINPAQLAGMDGSAGAKVSKPGDGLLGFFGSGAPAAMKDASSGGFGPPIPTALAGGGAARGALGAAGSPISAMTGGGIDPNSIAGGMGRAFTSIFG